MPTAGMSPDRMPWLAAAAFAIQVVLVTIVPDGDETLHRLAYVAEGRTE